MWSNTKVSAFLQNAQETIQEGLKEQEKKLSEAMDSVKHTFGIEGSGVKRASSGPDAKRASKSSSSTSPPDAVKVDSLKAMVPSMAGDGILAAHLTEAANLGPMVGPILSKAAKSKELILPLREAVDELCWAPYFDGRWYRAVLKEGEPFRWAIAADDPSLPLEALCPEGGVAFARSAWFAPRNEPKADDVPELPSLTLIEEKSSKIEKVKNALLVLQPTDIKELEESPEPLVGELENLKRKQEEAHDSLRDGNACIGEELRKVQQDHSEAKSRLGVLNQEVTDLMQRLSEKREELEKVESEVARLNHLEVRLLENLQTATDTWAEKIDRVEGETRTLQKRREWLEHLSKAKEMLEVPPEEEKERRQYMLDLQVSRYRTFEALCSMWESKLSAHDHSHGDEAEVGIAYDYSMAIWKSVVTDTVDAERQVPDDITAQLTELGTKYRDDIMVRLLSIRTRCKELLEDAAE
eukprot:GEMP01020774.1.p1 GENE.GEMP01020774.1~~GEMP01020774.1.p1  ORF type:complete len:468 (+),score=133.05 GEMP01020774.1:157-1560(+)